MAQPLTASIERHRARLTNALVPIVLRRNFAYPILGSELQRLSKIRSMPQFSPISSVMFRCRNLEEKCVTICGLRTCCFAAFDLDAAISDTIYCSWCSCATSAHRRCAGAERVSSRTQSPHASCTSKTRPHDVGGVFQHCRALLNDSGSCNNLQVGAGDISAQHFR